MKNAAAVLLVVALVCGPSLREASAQEPASRTLTTLGGVSVTGRGGSVLTSPVASVRLGLPVSRVLLLEPSLTWVSTDAPLRPRTHDLLTEIGAQLQWPGERLRPYVGLGAGTRWIIRSGQDGSDLALSVAGGLRYLVSGGWILRGELRGRAEPYGEGGVDFVLGAGRAF